MLTLSIQQPWAWLIVAGLKDIENRGWRTTRRGRFLVQAGLQMDKLAWAHMQEGRHPARPHLPLPPMDLPSQRELRMGGIVGMARLTHCVNDHPSDWFVGPWGFVLRDQIPMPFIPCRGQLGFFEAPPDVVQEVKRWGLLVRSTHSNRPPLVK
jgi:hypothetical protein